MKFGKNMSRLGKKPIIVPTGTEVSFKDGIFSVKGPQGALSRAIDPKIGVEIKAGEITLAPKVKEGAEALWGTYVAHIKNMVSGVNKLFEKRLKIEGVGYKADVKGEEVVLNIGYSHQVKVPIPKSVKAVSDKDGLLITGADIEAVGQFAAKVRSKKVPEPYQGKGIRYADEVVRRKQGKKTV